MDTRDIEYQLMSLAGEQLDIKRMIEELRRQIADVEYKLVRLESIR